MSTDSISSKGTGIAALILLIFSCCCGFLGVWTPLTACIAVVVPIPGLICGVYTCRNAKKQGDDTWFMWGVIATSIHAIMFLIILIALLLGLILGGVSLINDGNGQGYM